VTVAEHRPAAIHTHTRRPYRERSARYETAADRLATGGLSDRDSLADIGAGHTELDVCLRTAHGWRGRYLPVDRNTQPERWAELLGYLPEEQDIFVAVVETAMVSLRERRLRALGLPLDTPVRPQGAVE
jgi:hypothetical protein